MTDQQHPTITPPFELKQRWLEQAPRYRGRAHWLIDRASEWGYERRGEINEAKLQQARDQQLTECIQWLAQAGYAGPTICMRFALRPKPPSLAEQGLQILAENGTTLSGRIELDPEDIETFRAALVRLKQLEDSDD